MNDIFTILGYSLDVEQRKIVLDESDYLLVVAGAGTGKTLTILGKIRYLIEKKNIRPEEILCISFTNETTKSLSYKLKTVYKYNVDVKTFHKLALDNLQEKYFIAPPNFLDDVTTIFLENIIYDNSFLIKSVLKYFKIFTTNFNYLKKYDNLLIAKKIDDLQKLIVRFINLFKTYNYSKNNFKSLFYYKKYQNLLFIIYAIYIFYESELKSQMFIDFNDMINIASNQTKFNKKYKYIIVDEYQDTSLSRYKMLKKLVDFCQAKLLVVGDDYQSIYNFSGCSLEIFLNFTNYFSNANILNINNTYRNSLEIINIANNFIMKNPKQIKKALYSSKRIDKPLKFIYYWQIKNDFSKLILKVSQDGSGLILGRNSFDIYKYLDLNIFALDNNGWIYYNKKNINMRFLTIHKAKGLEADNVILINLENALYGFPSQVKSERILDILRDNNKQLFLEEERRLFYVALTRTKNNIYFYLNRFNVSSFIKEIKKEDKKYIEKIKTF